ncbi:MAG TPA: hypothetical protein DHV16_10365 [Nitrospiraceae bacterium]|nr:MAG: hypothetical protein A2Z82_06700 [Nitrospirae bacterium GWA2_46_11]OGW24710.1 MAG: hypothetical protein A2X55_06775 [Nitrospirae bacterium GWB2_47_37]HAK88442.1 hypothetical protein [Nitrospiraceae bacterium]HCZ12628.1 hypothetical protein [Nitrospiraceae bacterium]
MLDGLSQIFFLNLALGAILGFVFHRSDLCMAGMFRDIFLLKRTFLLRILFLQVVVTMVFFFIAKKLGLIGLYPPPNLGLASLGTIMGGIVFGAGMVLAGGCVMGTLYKMGSGSIISIIAFAGLIIGSAIFAEFYPAWLQITKKTAVSEAVLLSQLADENLLTIPVLIFSSIIILRWINLKKLSQKAYAEGYIDPWKVAIIIAVLNLIIYLSSDMPMAVSTGYAKIAAYIEKALIPEHFDTVAFFGKESYSVLHPVSKAAIVGGPMAVFDHMFATEISLIIGVVLGSFISAIMLGEFKLTLSTFPPPKQNVSALMGGMLLALGSRMAGGCNVKFLMSGLPLLSIQAFLFVFGMLPGAWIGTYLFKKFVISYDREGQ